MVGCLTQYEVTLGDPVWQLCTNRMAPFSLQRRKRWL